ncbi:uncharacterized protein LOC111388490 [Olea europaea var. sylvestris]|uniref:uncharacterized protein LOC111388490 n=1 Tax=Olea europaea var. sylvestris TaxID=158386 RepID=UPI000C1D0F3D|nr:uncharacterized protein LOC111388490 [Olea europaea var. sylvestris]
MVNSQLGLSPASSSTPIPHPTKDQPAPQEESSGVPAPQLAVVTTEAFEELRQQVVTLKQLLSQRNSPPSPAQVEHGGFIADARARPPNLATGGVGTSGICNMASGSRSVAMDSSEIAQIIQEGITAGLQRSAWGPTGFTPDTPFTPEILSYPLPDIFKYPCIKEYDGMTDPVNHLNVYTDVMNLQVAPHQVMCKAFLQTLTNAARDWFSTLDPNSIASFSDLVDKFSAFSASSKRIRKTAASLMQLRQGPNETLLGFMTRFNKDRLQITDLHITMAVSALTYAIRCEAFKMSLSKTSPQTVIELLTRAEKYINMEETLNPRRYGPSHEKVKNEKQHDPISRPKYPREKCKNQGPPGPLTQLNTSKANILMEIKDMKELKWPSRMKSSPDTRDKSKYCEFHQDHGYTTEDCQALQWEIEALIKRGLLRNYIGHDKCPRNDRDNRKEPGVGSSAQPTAKTINIIIEGIKSGGNTNSGRKQYARQHAHTSRESPDKLKNITFEARDLEGISYPHDDALGRFSNFGQL